MSTDTAAEKQTTANANQPLDLPSLCLAFTERAPLPMATVEGATHIVRHANPAFCALMGKPKEQLVGKLISDLLPAKDQCVALLDRVLRTGRPASHAEHERSRQPLVFWSYTMWPVLADERLVGVVIQVTETAKFHEKTVAMNEALMLGAVRQHELKEAADRLNAKLELEIAERKHTQRALMEAKAALADEAAHLERIVSQRTAELTSSNKQLEAFVYTIAHDLRAPLRSMQGFSDMLVSGEDPSGAVDYAQRISTSARLMDAMLIDLLAFSRISQEKLDLGPIHLEAIVQTTLARLAIDIQKANGQVDATGPWPTVLAHGPTVGQVVFNLVSNALKFVRPGVPPQIRLRAEDASSTHPSNPSPHTPTTPPVQPGFIRVWVEDHGIGIAPEHQEQIFRLFLRLHRDAYEGTGVGLAIVQKGIERMGGRIGVESSANQGSRFWFDLRKAH
jgi:signal transduction histidine kinase